ncbi:hypothetical protein [Bacillus sp. FSL K6-0268]
MRTNYSYRYTHFHVGGENRYGLDSQKLERVSVMQNKTQGNAASREV